MQLLTWAMGFFGGDPSVPVIRDGKETFPLVPVAVGLYSTAFNVFNTALLFPFVGVFERVLSRVGRTSSEDVEDYSMARFLDRSKGRELAAGVPLVQQEMARYVEARQPVSGDRRARRSRPPATPRIIRRPSTFSAATSGSTPQRCSSPTCRAARPICWRA